MNKLNINIFKKRSNLVHKNKYDYSKVIYTKINEPVEIICPKHGSFWQTPVHHMKGFGCSECKKEKESNRFRLTNSQFLERAYKIHGSKYKYDLTNYKNCNTKIKIHCPLHGWFYQRALAHLQGHGCSLCRTSSNERKISIFLEKNNIPYISQYKIKDCRRIMPLPFDFAIFNEDDSLKCLIEYQGEQHFKIKKFYGGKDFYKLQKERDKIKRDYCRKNNIKLYYITYKQNTLECLKVILKEKINNEEYKRSGV